jgi:3-keto-5-aminohexanoate cleavage enzyme
VEKLIVNLVPTGMIPTKKQSPHVPTSPQEIIEDVLKCCELGVTMVHLHGRDKNESPAWEPEIFEEIILGIRKEQPELVICVTCSGRTYNEFEKRSAVLELDGDAKPDMASLTLSSVNFNRQVSVNEPTMIIALVKKMQEKGIKPELEVFDLGMINYARYLISKKMLKPPHYFNLIFGNIACAQADLLSVGLMVNDLPENSIWSLGGVGNSQYFINTLAVISGGGVRIGLEDNLWFDTPQRTRLASNYQLLERLKMVAGSFGRNIMPQDEARHLLCLQSANEGYGINKS